MAPPKGKGKDFSRMTVPPPAAPAPAAAAPTGSPPAGGGGSSTPRSGKPKGKDFSRMASQQPTPPAPAPGQPPAADARVQNARAAVGYPPQGAPVPVTTTQYAPQPGQPLGPNAAPTYKPLPPSQPKKEVPPPTARPGWSEGRLSTKGGYGKAALAPVVGEKLQSLCKSIDPSYSLDSEVQERLVEMADTFVDKVTQDAIKLARHRGSNTMDAVDVALALKKGYNMEVPGLGPPIAPGAGGGQGGWLFADKVNAGGGEPPKKKSKPTDIM